MRPNGLRSWWDQLLPHIVLVLTTSSILVSTDGGPRTRILSRFSAHFAGSEMTTGHSGVYGSIFLPPLVSHAVEHSFRHRRSSQIVDGIGWCLIHVSHPAVA